MTRSLVIKTWEMQLHMDFVSPLNIWKILSYKKSIIFKKKLFSMQHYNEKGPSTELD